MTAIQEQIAADLEKALAAGTLTTDALRRGIREITGRSDKAMQDLLYLQAVSVGVDSQVLGMRVLIDGEFDDGPDEPEDWPYKSVLEAIRDGWRVISFPNLALLMDESKTYGLGHEFILEKWR